MEINISIKDAAGAAGHHVSVSGATNGVDAEPTDSQAAAASALKLGAINAGPAPAGLAFGGNNAPMRFINNSAIGQGQPSDESAGTAPPM